MKKIMKKRILSVVLVIAMCLPMAACSKGGSGDGERTLHILGTVRRYEGEEEAWEEVFKDFEEEYNCTVEYRWQGKVDDMVTNLEAAKISGEEVDICFPNGGRVYSSLAPNGMLMDLTELMEPLKDRFKDGVLDYYTIGDHLWGFPYGDQSSSVLYYNKTMFDELGLEEPETFDDLIECGKVIREQKGIMPMIHQGKTQSYWLMYYGDIYAQTSGNQSIENIHEFLTGQHEFTGEAEIEAFDVFKRM